MAGGQALPFGSMSTVAFVFPGQGSQTVGMGRALVESSPAAAAIFEEADRVLGEPLSRLAFEGPADDLDQTVNAQPALLATSVAMLTVLRARWSDAGVDVRPAFSAGPLDGPVQRARRGRRRLVRRRPATGPGARTAHAGLRAPAVPARWARSSASTTSRWPQALARARAATSGLVGVANRNAPGQVVISGERPAVEAALDAARELRARKVVLLPVSVAAHSPLMADAAAGMRAVLADVAFADPDPPLLANADAAPLTTADAARAELVDHLTTGVDWVAVVGAMAAAGVDTFLEIGPGRVLTGLIKRIAPGTASVQVDDPDGDGIAPAAVLRR